MEELLEPDSDERVVKREVVTENSDTIPTREVRHFNSPGLLRGIILAIIGIILIVLLVLLARWIYHSVHNTADTTPTSGSQTLRTPGVNNESSTGQNSTSGGSSSSSSSPSSSSSTSRTSTGTNGSLPNNGPGDVAAIFAGTTLAAAGLHYIISLRRQRA